MIDSYTRSIFRDIHTHLPAKFQCMAVSQHLHQWNRIQNLHWVSKPTAFHLEPTDNKYCHLISKVHTSSIINVGTLHWDWIATVIIGLHAHKVCVSPGTYIHLGYCTCTRLIILCTSHLVPWVLGMTNSIATDILIHLSVQPMYSHIHLSPEGVCFVLQISFCSACDTINMLWVTTQETKSLTFSVLIGDFPIF